MFYFCSMGSNIDPAHNVCRTIESLADNVAPVTLSPLIQTAPHGMQSAQPFYNALFWFESSENADMIKQRFNGIETSLGRNRNDPDKKTKDRPIDLDILYAGPARPLAELRVDDPYLSPLTPILSGKAPTASVISLQFAGKRLGLGVLHISRSGDGFRVERAALP